MKTRDALVAALIRRMDDPTSTAGVVARKRYLENCTAARMAPDIEGIYDRLIDETTTDNQ